MHICNTILNWPQTIAEIQRQRQLTARALASEVGVSPALLSRLASGAQASTSFEAGVALLTRAQEAGVTGLALRVQWQPAADARAIGGELATPCKVLQAPVAANEPQCQNALVSDLDGDKK